MPSAHDRAIELIEQGLRSLDYEVKRISTEEEEESADLLAYQAEDRFVVEVKTRLENIEEREQLEAEPTGTVVDHHEPLTRENRLSGIVKKAADQIRHTQTEHPGLGLLWFCPEPLLGIADSSSRLEATVYGVRHAFVEKEGKNFPFSKVYMATHNDFYRFQIIDAVVLDGSDGMRLLVNPFSPKKEILRTSRVYQFFSSQDAITDLVTADPANGVFIVQGNFSRGDQRAVSRALTEQYPGYRFHFCEPLSLGGFVRFNLPGQADADDS